MKRKHAKKGSEGVSWTIVVLVIALFLLFVIGYSIYRYVKAPLYGAGETALANLKDLKSINAIQSKEYGELSRDQRNSLLDSYAEKDGCQELEKILTALDKPSSTTSKTDPKQEQLITFDKLVACYASPTNVNSVSCDNAANSIKTNQKFFTDTAYKTADNNYKTEIINTYVYAGQCYETIDSLNLESINKAIEYYQMFVNAGKSTSKYNLDEIKAKITALKKSAADASSTDRQALNEDYKKAIAAYGTANPANSQDLSTLQIAANTLNEFTQKYNTQNDPITRNYVATIYYFEGQIYGRIGQLQGNNLCLGKETGFGALITDISQYQAATFVSTGASGPKIIDKVSNYPSAQAGYELVACAVETRQNAETANKLVVLVTNYPNDQATAKAITLIKPECTKIPEVNACNAKNAELKLQGVLSTSQLSQLRCYFRQSDKFFSGDGTGTCLSCAEIKRCEDYGATAETCTNDPCGVGKCESSWSDVCSKATSQQ